MLVSPPMAVKPALLIPGVEAAEACALEGIVFAPTAGPVMIVPFMFLTCNLVWCVGKGLLTVENLAALTQIAQDCQTVRGNLIISWVHLLITMFN